ncbi:glutathione-dependent formaldehyde-activating enzyme [Colletotrichum karsti]|uniref:Glutathione-dependent formaldehyde-activating enzyme n=1 Tax=Colletotrichum karsti TaxID=1095194 RepID=A0A9P6LQL8_9PEZI|nr:glutathione-dependent formaldehyde-activating enzyme [Colletotrichum karsti]KAF9881821.1 glutathione-dependent formaldehyde-activating enzyme [Colletotrichum karsti]
MTPDEPKQTYRGNCHCKAFVYEVQLPEIKSVSQCNCSVCTKKGTLWVLPSPDDFRVVKGAVSDLSSYNFASGQMTHKFCGNCGTAIMVDFPNGPPGRKMALNVRAMQDLDIFGLEKKPFDGSSFGDKYTPPAHKGPSPTADIEGGKLYTGSCHCGDVTVAVMSKPLDETFEEWIVDCNCSICERNGYVWIYPKVEHVVLTGDDDKIGRYSFGHHILYKTFCKRCGVPMTNCQMPKTEEEFAALAEAAQYWHSRMAPMNPVNVRVLNGVDLKSLKIQQLDGKTEHQPGYENP